MQSDVKSPRHSSREVSGFRGLRTSALDTRSLPDGWLAQATNVVFDPDGNARPKDGSEIWWPQISQRSYLAEMEPAENSTWAGGTATAATKAFGSQSRTTSAAGATPMTRTPGSAIGVLLGGEYTAAQASLTIYVRAATPADVASCTLELTSGAFASNTRTWDITAAVNALVADVWTAVTVALSGGTDTGGAPAFSAINGIRVTPTLTAGTAIYFDELFVSYSDYTKSFCLGAIEYRRSSDSKRYTMAGFGETLYADLNEAKTPYKVASQLSRNVPIQFDIAEDRLVVVNGVDDGLVFNGDVVRRLGFPKPSSWTPAFAYAGGGTLTPGDVYYYGVTFVYGTSAADKHGQSSMLESPTAATVSAGNSRIDLSNLPVGAVGAGVIARRIYRCRANAGQYASKYFVAEVADNTTTTYQDGAADSVILTGDVGPLNNGLPPVSRAAVWFQKGLVYFTKKAVHWSRPGVNLDESFEIVPAENILLMGSAGELVGAIEFNGNLYVFARAGISKLQWSGSVLSAVPVQRTSEQRAGNIGAIADRAITVVQDRYIRFMDTTGQVWKMLPNEEIQPESAPVRNLLNDCNNLPLSTSLDYNSVDSLAQWQVSGSLDADTNLSVSDEEGALVYGKANLPKTAIGAGNVRAQYTAVANQYTARPLGWTVRPAGPGTFDGVFSAASQEFVFAVSGRPGVPLRIDVVSVWVAAQGAWRGDQDVSFQLFPHRTKYEAANSRGSSIASSTAQTIRPTLADVLSRPDGFQLTFTLSSPVYLPAQETMYFTLVTSGAYAPDGGGVPVFIGIMGGPPPTDLVCGDPYWDEEETWEVPLYAGMAPRLAWSGQRYSQATQQTLTAYDAGATLQRFHQFAADSLTMRSFGRIQVVAQYSTDGVLWWPSGTGTGQLLYERVFIGANTAAGEPVYSERYLFPLPPDYRSGEAPPSGQHWKWIRLLINMTDTSAAPTPASEALSRVSTDYTVALPQVVNPEMTTATEAVFSAPYDKVDYARDIWTSEPISTAGIYRFGKLYADYAEAQQLVSFQVRTATSALGLASATWYAVTPNTEVGTTGVVASATHFQYRIIFQDNPGRFEGTPSAVYEVRWSWAITGAENAPMTPPVLYHYKDYTYISWPSGGSRINDLSLAIDDHTLAYENEDGHRWSLFRAPHYACYCLVGNKLIGGTASGGRLVRLRNSAVTEYDGRQVVSAVRTLPMNMGSMFLKTLHWAYFGLVLNVHRAGEFFAELGRWPDSSTAGWTFDWFVDGGVSVLPSPGGPPSIAYQQAMGLVVGQQGYKGLLSHAHTAQQLALYPNTRPYQAEYGVDLGLQERAFAFQANWSPKLETSTGIAIFPTLTNIGMEFYIENYRGV